MYLYIFFEIAYLFCIIINIMLNKYPDVLNLGPVIISIIYTLINKMENKKGNIYLILSLFFALSGDIFFILIDKHTLGVASFIIIQMFYLFFLKGKSIKILLLIILNFVMSIILDEKILIIEAIFYATIFITNIIIAIKYVKGKKISYPFLLAIIFLLICDINVLVIDKINLPKWLDITCNIIEWINYSLNLIIITLLSNKLIDYKKR